MEVKGNVQSCAQAGVQTQGEHLVDGQSPGEQLEGQDTPAALGNRQWSAEVHHLTDGGQQRRKCQILILM